LAASAAVVFGAGLRPIGTCRTGNFGSVNPGFALRADGAATGTEHGSAATDGLVAIGSTSDATVVDTAVSAAIRPMAGMSHLSGIA
jgi:hypothetical protein